MNIGALWPSLVEARERVLGMQTKLHQWASTDGFRRFDDLYNLVYDPAFLAVAWSRVKGNKGARSAGVDGQTARYIDQQRGTAEFLNALRDDLKSRTFTPLPVRERMIPKPGGKKRRLGIPTTRDRVVQASLKLVLEPIFEADFKPCSYGFRPGRRPHDAIAEIHMLASNRYEWVLEADIEACFDNIDHTALLGRVVRRVGDRRVVRLVKAFLKSGILSEDAVTRDTNAGTPQGGILFLGFRIQRHVKEGTDRRYVYTYPSKKALGSIKRKVKTITKQGTNNTLADLLRRLNPVLRGWTNYFRHGVSKATFGYLRHYTWWRVVRWLRRKYRRTGWKKLRTRFLRYDDKTWVSDGEVELFDPAAVAVTRYRYRGNVPTPWAQREMDHAA